ncbi:hypothetical protein [Streptomyces rhizosphaerihabitans]|uniref:hypothetical protein n=1 Tax=Streptomyces rhizosphaerihabitans TaxID=1266770 RepID=UPI0028F6D496|nr:hypothetical protein [Streptomyces rhizosphaerihabitans]
MTDRLFSGEVQHLVEVLGREDLLVGTAVAAHSALHVQNEEQAARITHEPFVLVA